MNDRSLVLGILPDIGGAVRYDKVAGAVIVRVPCGKVDVVIKIRNEILICTRMSMRRITVHGSAAFWQDIVPGILPGAALIWVRAVRPVCQIVNSDPGQACFRCRRDVDRDLFYRIIVEISGRDLHLRLGDVSVFDLVADEGGKLEGLCPASLFGAVDHHVDLWVSHLAHIAVILII